MFIFAICEHEHGEVNRKGNITRKQNQWRYNHRKQFVQQTASWCGSLYFLMKIQNILTLCTRKPQLQVKLSSFIYWINAIIQKIPSMKQKIRNEDTFLSVRNITNTRSITIYSSLFESLFENTYYLLYNEREGSTFKFCFLKLWQKFQYKEL